MDIKHMTIYIKRKKLMETLKNKKERFVQIQNPKSKQWVKIDRKLGKIVGHKSTPYKNIEKRN